jgi:uncharacterized lipoprotein YmbA
MRHSSALPLRASAVLLLALCCALAGCSGLLDPRPDPSRFFVLDPSAAPSSEETPLSGDGVSVGLGPVRIAEYLRRPELVTRTGATEIRPSAVDRWAEPLDSALPRVLAKELAASLGTPRVALYPWYRRNRPDFQISIDLLQFERDADNGALLAARWEVRELATDGRRIFRESRIARPAGSGDTEAVVLALHGTLGELAREIAAALNELHAAQ